ncbi:GRAS family protein [Lentzea sp. NPDC060358]|uniref:GRAS family protein n=1 Tax=Lentzea sp. NPDC060358 TaxID=3347103 RepID=UPI003650077C
MTTVFSLFDEAADAALQDDRAALGAVLERIRATTSADPRLRDFFLAAFASRLDATGQDRRPRAGEADLLRVLTRNLPLLRAVRHANDRLLAFLDGRESATVLALGIGRGRQECDLLQRAPDLRSLTVIGVDTAAEHPGGAEAALRATGARVGAEVVFHPVRCAPERLDESFWHLVRDSPRPLLVTASFSLHHLRDDENGDTRTALFQRVRDLGPAAFALCERHADHHRVPFRTRFGNAWRHYGTLFEAIDSTAAADTEKAAMKQYFGPEIENVVGARDEERFERHEPADAWARRFTGNGFRLMPGPRTVSGARGGFWTRALPDRVELGYEDTTLVAVFVGTPDWSHAR